MSLTPFVSPSKSCAISVIAARCDRGSYATVIIEKEGQRIVVPMRFNGAYRAGMK